MSMFDLLDFYNSTLFNNFKVYLDGLLSVINLNLGSISENQTHNFEEIKLLSYDFWSFNDFQVKLFKWFSIVLLLNCLCIYITWNIYGARISSRFMKTGTWHIGI